MKRILNADEKAIRKPLGFREQEHVEDDDPKDLGGNGTLPTSGPRTHGVDHTWDDVTARRETP